MEKKVLRVLVVFTIGFLAIGVILGFVGNGDCGSVFSPADHCSSDLAVQRALVIAFIGLGLTTMAAAIVTDQPTKGHDRHRDDGDE
jgi:uncharacterized membrane protein